MNSGNTIPYTVIVGAGITGLTAGYLLAKSGEKCLILESDNQPGGLCRSFKMDNVLFDLGPHILFLNTPSREIRFIKQLLKNEPLIRNRYQFAIQSHGRSWKFPNFFTDLLWRYPYRYKKEILMTNLLKRRTPHADIASVQAMVEEKSGQGFYRDNYAPLMLKKALIPGDTLHRDWALRVDRTIDNTRMHQTGFDRTVPLAKRIKALLCPEYDYPLNGFGIIPGKLFEDYERAGGETLFETANLRLIQKGKKITHIETDIRNPAIPEFGFRRIAINNLIWTASVNHLNRLLGAPSPTLSYVDTVIVLLTFKRKTKKTRPYIYTLHADEDTVFNRLYYPDNIYKQDCLPDREGICAEINLPSGTARPSKETILSQTLAGIEKLDLYPKDDMRTYQLIDLKDSMPVYSLDYENKISDLFKTVQEYDNLHAIGRMGGYFFCQTPGAILQGIKMAEYLLQKNLV